MGALTPHSKLVCISSKSPFLALIFIHLSDHRALSWALKEFLNLGDTDLLKWNFSFFSEGDYFHYHPYPYCLKIRLDMNYPLKFVSTFE